MANRTAKPLSYLGRVRCEVLKTVSLEGGMQGRGPFCNDGRIRVGIIIATGMVDSFTVVPSRQ